MCDKTDTECEHAIGIYNSGVGTETIFVTADDPELTVSPQFHAFKFCPYCGKAVIKKKRMDIKKIYIGQLPPEVGQPGEKLIVLLDNGRYESILIEGKISAYVLADQLRILSVRITGEYLSR